MDLPSGKVPLDRIKSVEAEREPSLELGVADLAESESTLPLTTSRRQLRARASDPGPKPQWPQKTPNTPDVIVEEVSAQSRLPIVEESKKLETQDKKISRFSSLFKRKIKPKPQGNVSETKADLKSLKTFEFVSKHLNFYRMHLLYFISLGIAGGLIIHGIEKQAGHDVALIDSFFTSYSALCVTGLIVIDTTQLHPGSIGMLAVLIFLGGNVFMSLVPLLIRRSYFYEELGKDIEKVHPYATKQEIRRPSWQLTLTALEERIIQFHALNLLMKVIIGYIVILHLLGFIILSIYLNTSSAGIRILQENGNQNAFAFSVFLVISSFGNAGFCTFALNLIPFAENSIVLLTSGVLILCGNTMFPIFLRLCIWILKKRAQDKTIHEYLMSHPRKCFTMLFPSINTQALLLTVFLIQISQWFVSLTLDWRSASLIDKNPAEKFLITFYQSISTRTAGFNVVDMSKLNPPLEILTLQGQTSPARQLLESAFMYMASVPVVVTLRASAIVHSSPAVQEEEEEMMRKKPGLFSGPLQVMQWMKKRNFLIREAGLLFFLILLITIFEDEKFPNDINFDVFRVIYESVSAYGTVGLSLGYPNQVTSFSARFSTISKFIMCIIMLMGRQRGIPTSIDSAVSLTSTKRSENPRRRQTDADVFSFGNDGVDQRVDASFVAHFSPGDASFVQTPAQTAFIKRMDSEGQTRFLKAEENIEYDADWQPKPTPTFDIPRYQTAPQINPDFIRKATA